RITASGKYAVRANESVVCERLQAHALPYFLKMCDVREANKHIEGENPLADVRTFMSEAERFANVRTSIVKTQYCIIIFFI
ncbi:MAG: hypothetical protein KKB77_08370, partial [Bacteroidetes bacterium]|nr:hypothetical protein [Bacteroidota bacterium]